MRCTKFVCVCFSIVTTKQRLWPSYKPWSGKRTPLLALPPLETVHAPFNAHSLSTSRTTRLLLPLQLGQSCSLAFVCRQRVVVMLLAVAHFARSPCMDLLMAECMNQYQIAVTIFPSCRSCQTVMNLDLFIIEEGFKALETSSLLPAGKLLF